MYQPTSSECHSAPTWRLFLIPDPQECPTMCIPAAFAHKHSVVAGMPSSSYAIHTWRSFLFSRRTQWSRGGPPRKCLGDKPPLWLLCRRRGAFRILVHVQRSTTRVCANKTPALAHSRLPGLNFNGLPAELGDTHSHARTLARAGGCLAWIRVGEAVMTKAGQIGKPHPAGTGEEGQGGWAKWEKQVIESVCVCVCGSVCVFGGFFLCKVIAKAWVGPYERRERGKWSKNRGQRE